MKPIKLLLLVAAALTLHVQELPAQVFSVKSYKVTVSGTSSLHDWESTVEKLYAKGSFSLSNNTLSEIRDVVVNIPVMAIKSTKGKMMDNKTWEAFNHEKNKTITFALTGKKIDPANNSIVASGTLTMAGFTKPVELNLIYKVLAGGELQISGAYTLRMTDFKMDPPTAMMGTIKVGDEVVVRLEIVLVNANNTL